MSFPFDAPIGSNVYLHGADGMPLTKIARDTVLALSTVKTDGAIIVHAGKRENNVTTWREEKIYATVDGEGPCVVRKNGGGVYVVSAHVHTHAPAYMPTLIEDPIVDQALAKLAHATKDRILKRERERWDKKVAEQDQALASRWDEKVAEQDNELKKRARMHTPAGQAAIIQEAVKNIPADEFEKRLQEALDAAGI